MESATHLRSIPAADAGRADTDQGDPGALRQALAGGRLQLLYQPLVDLHSGAVVSLEALLLQPGDSASGALAAVRAGLCAELDAWILRQVCHDLRAWRANGLTALRVTINLGAAQLREPGYAATLGATLADCALPAAALALETSEQSIDEAGAGGEATLAALKALGLALTLDEFGSGRVSLSTLKRCAFDSVKIAPGLIADVVTDSAAAALCKTLISLAHQLGLKVAAEGVGSESQCDFLRRQMCEQIQGELFAPPLPFAAVSALLEDARALAPHLRQPQQAPRRLLLVDDEPNIVAALKRLLRADHYQIHSANDGEAGLALLATQPVDVIISDQRMPGMLGADFLRKARQLYPDTIRIMLSGYTELQSVTDAVNEGAIYKFLTKPWDDALLRGHVAEAFRLKEIADDNLRLHLAVRGANQELAAANRRMEQLLQEKQRQISRDEISLNIARELLQHLPLPVIGMDDDGMIAFINGAAEGLFQQAGALLGEQASQALPALFAADQATPLATIDGQHYSVMVYPMGEQSASRGSLITLSPAGNTP